LKRIGYEDKQEMGVRTTDYCSQRCDSRRAPRSRRGGGALTHLDGGGAFNPQAIPNALINGVCQPVYPHDYIKTNAVFEAVKQNRRGARTAWADKHAWGYDWLNGPSGSGVDDLSRTEINSSRTDYPAHARAQA
jgi:hypothetical protein